MQFSNPVSKRKHSHYYYRLVIIVCVAGENYPYVQLTAIHDYLYPNVDDQKPAPGRRDSASSLKQPPLPQKYKKCKYCEVLYTEDNNPRGSCKVAPDCPKSTINTITCIACAECVCYHCARDAEGNFPQEPCDCTMDENCTKRWMCLTFLSLFVPCLWFYPPLKWCHWCGIKCGICGARHSI